MNLKPFKFACGISKTKVDVLYTHFKNIVSPFTRWEFEKLEKSVFSLFFIFPMIFTNANVNLLDVVE